MKQENQEITSPGLIIDTDIGSDIDDAIALTYAVRAKMDLKLITTVHNDTQRRGKIAKTLLDLLGVDVPVVAGIQMPKKQKHLFAAGTELLYNTTKQNVPSNAIEQLAATVTTHPGIEITAIGPLTNIASLIENYPAIKENIGRIYVMGNAIITKDTYYLNYRSHNLKVDPEAADIVFASNIPITLVTTEVCKQHSFSKSDFETMRTHDAALAYIATNADHWLKLIEQDKAYLYDPLVIHLHKYPVSVDVVTFGNVSITTGVRQGFDKQCLNTLLNGRETI